MLRTGEVASALGVSRKTVYAYIAHGLLIPDEVGQSWGDGVSGRRLFKESTVLALQKQLSVSQEAKAEQSLIEEKLYSTRDVAQILGVSRSTVSNYLAKGVITPDYVLAPRASGRSGDRRFKLSTIEAVKERLNGERSSCNGTSAD